MQNNIVETHTTGEVTSTYSSNDSFWFAITIKFTPSPGVNYVLQMALPTDFERIEEFKAVAHMKRVDP